MDKIYLIIFVFFTANSWGNSPAWITHPGKHCPSSELCAVGVGADLNQASTRAREELAKIFKVKIISDTFIKTRAEMQGTSEEIDGDVSEIMQKDISEIADMVIEGSFQKESFKSAEKVYVLIALNRKKAARIIEGEIGLLDEQIERLYNEGRRGSIFKAIALFSPRDQLNLKHDFLIETKIPPKISLKALTKKKNDFLKKNVTILLENKGPSKHKEIRDYLTTLLLKMGYRVITKPSTRYNYSVDFYLNWQEEYLKVPGFVKYQYEMKIYSYNLVKIKIGTLSKEAFESGRNFNQCFRRAKEGFKKYLIENINDMNLD